LPEPARPSSKAKRDRRTGTGGIHHLDELTKRILQSAQAVDKILRAGRLACLLLRLLRLRTVLFAFPLVVERVCVLYPLNTLDRM
jgi:hypothetical protein